MPDDRPALDSHEIVKMRRGDCGVGNILPGIRPAGKEAAAGVQMPLARTKFHGRVFNVEAGVGFHSVGQRAARQRDDIGRPKDFANLISRLCPGRESDQFNIPRPRPLRLDVAGAKLEFSRAAGHARTHHVKETPAGNSRAFFALSVDEKLMENPISVARVRDFRLPEIWIEPGAFPATDDSLAGEDGRFMGAGRDDQAGILRSQY